MSKLVKNMLIDDLRHRLEGVGEVILVSLGRLDARQTTDGAMLLANFVHRIAGLKEFEGFECRGGALDGSRLGADDVKQVAKWPTRSEQLSLLSGQISSLASLLAGQIVSAGGTLAGQNKSRCDDLEKAAPEAAEAT